MTRTVKKDPAKFREGYTMSNLGVSPLKRAGTKLARDVGVISDMELREIRSKAGRGEQKDAIIITKGDLDLLRQRLVIRTKHDENADYQMRQAAKTTAMAASTFRKTKMMELDKKRENKRPLTDFELEEKGLRNGILDRLQRTRDEQLDDVKRMNQLVFYSKVVTVRDKQLIESKMLEEEFREEQKKLDLMMEIERLKSLKAQQERE